MCSTKAVYLCYCVYLLLTNRLNFFFKHFPKFRILRGRKVDAHQGAGLAAGVEEGAGGEFGVLQKRNHLLRVEVRVVDVRSLVLGRQKRAVPKLGEPHRPAGAQDDVAGQVGVFGAKTCLLYTSPSPRD